MSARRVWFARKAKTIPPPAPSLWAGVLRGVRSRAVCVAVAATLPLAISACGGQYRVQVDNQTDAIIYAGIMQRTRAGLKMLTTGTIAAGESTELSADAEAVGGGTGDPRALPGGLSGVTLMIGQTPSPRDRALYQTLEKGDNAVVVRKAGPRKDAPIYLTRE